MAVNPLREHGSRPGVWALLLGLSAIAWLVVAREGGAAVGLMGMTPVEYAGGWLVMTAAMMLPAIAWFGSIYVGALRRETSAIMRDFAVGVEHGAWCVACCWALMVTVVAVGTMSLTWMAVVAAVIVLERSLRHGAALSRAVGVGLLGVGLIVPFVDRIAPALHAGGM